MKYQIDTKDRDSVAKAIFDRLTTVELMADLIDGAEIIEDCTRCGCGRHTDTWAQRMDTGEQGLREVTYRHGEFAAEIAAANDE